MKKIIFFILVISSQSVHSVELKLICNITLNEIFSDGTTKTSQLSEVLEIIDNGKTKLIIPTSDLLGGVTTKKSGTLSPINDSSDVNKWDITSENKLSDGTTSTTTFRIDRNIGNIWYSNTFITNGRVTRQSGVGNCEKINLTKKKF